MSDICKWRILKAGEVKTECGGYVDSLSLMQRLVHFSCINYCLFCGKRVQNEFGAQERCVESDFPAPNDDYTTDR